MGKLWIIATVLVVAGVTPVTSYAQEGYPVCTQRGQDHCQNQGEGGAPGRSRAADFPGAAAAYGNGTDYRLHGQGREHYMAHHRRHRHYAQ